MTQRLGSDSFKRVVAKAVRPHHIFSSSKAVINKSSANIKLLVIKCGWQFKIYEKKLSNEKLDELLDKNVFKTVKRKLAFQNGEKYQKFSNFVETSLFKSL